MSGRYFEFGKRKFWKITVKGSSHTVHFGKLTAVGQKRTKEFGSTAEAWADADKLIVSKKRKGYKEKPNKRK